MSNSKISDKDYDKYLESARSINEYSGDFDIVDLESDDEVIDFANQYEAEIVEFFKGGGYSFNDNGKKRCIKDYMRKIGLKLNFGPETSIQDLVEEIDWSDIDGPTEDAINQLEEIIESIQEFIEDYRKNDAFIPNPKHIIDRWVEELQTLSDKFKE